MNFDDIVDVRRRLDRLELVPSSERDSEYIAQVVALESRLPSYHDCVVHYMRLCAEQAEEFAETHRRMNQKMDDYAKRMTFITQERERISKGVSALRQQTRPNFETVDSASACRWIAQYAASVMRLCETQEIRSRADEIEEMLRSV